MAKKSRKHTREFKQSADNERSERENRRLLRLRIGVIVVVVLMVSISALAIVLPRRSSSTSSKNYVQYGKGASVPVIANYDDLRALARDYEFTCDFSHEAKRGQFVCSKVMYSSIVLHLDFFGEGCMSFYYYKILGTDGGEQSMYDPIGPTVRLRFSLDRTTTALWKWIINWKYDETEFKQKLKNSSEIMREILTKAIVLYGAVKSDDAFVAATDSLTKDFSFYLVPDD
jgi:hypothetical protein